jgi:hypothetical protein
MLLNIAETGCCDISGFEVFQRFVLRVNLLIFEDMNDNFASLQHLKTAHNSNVHSVYI